MKVATSSLLGEEYLAPAVSTSISAPHTSTPGFARAAPAKPKQGKPTARVEPAPSTADIATILAEIERAGFDSTNETKKLAEFKSPGGQTIYVVKTTSRLNNIKVMVHPGLKPEALRLLDGVDMVSDEHQFHSNMTRFPKRLHAGQTETAYGWQVSITTFVGLPRFLAAFKAVSF
jgi:hypothetical protein